MSGLTEITTYTFKLPLIGFNITVNPVTIITTWVIIIVMLILARVCVCKLSFVPSRKQSILELIVEWFKETAEDAAGKDAKSFIPLIATIFLFILFCNWSSLIPKVKSPTGDINTCLGLGLLVFFVSHGYAIRKKGFLKYIKNYFKPMWILFPSNVFSEISKVLSHSFRLFGNIFAGGIIIAMIPAILSELLKWWGVPLGIIIMPALNIFFGFFIGVVQALVFALLAAAYIGVLSN